jgi:MFS family permease
MARGASFRAALPGAPSRSRSAPAQREPPSASARLPALDWLNFFVADLQTGFGPFIAVYLTTNKWTQGQIGVVLSIGAAATMLAQVPAGALVDALPRKRLAATAGLLALAASAVLLAVWPGLLPVTLSQVLHGFATCMLVPAVAAISLNQVGRAAFGERLGRNARFAALGSAAGAALMGLCGTYLSSQAVFWLAAALTVPALAAVRALPPAVPPPLPASLPPPEVSGRARWGEGWGVLLDRRLLAFALCIVLFQLANAAMLPLAAAEVTRHAGDRANLVIAACLMVPQGIVALLSPWVGRAAERHGRRVLLFLAFMMLPVRGLLLATVASPALVVMAQALDGIAGAVIGVLVPLVAADLTRGTGRFNLCMGAVGLAVGVGATLSTAIAGSLAGQFGDSFAFLALAVFGVIAVIVVAVAMPETRAGGAPAAFRRRPLPVA